MSRKIIEIHKEDDNEREELKFVNKVNDDTFLYCIQDISVDERIIIIIIIKNILQSRMERRGPYSSGL
jgi:disulfide oxidoreductase YuzD